jgi:hypothetical protein
MRHFVVHVWVEQLRSQPAYGAVDSSSCVVRDPGFVAASLTWFKHDATKSRQLYTAFTVDQDVRLINRLSVGGVFHKVDQYARHSSCHEQFLRRV